MSWNIGLSTRRASGKNVFEKSFQFYVVFFDVQNHIFYDFGPACAPTSPFNVGAWFHFGPNFSKNVRETCGHGARVCSKKIIFQIGKLKRSPHFEWIGRYKFFRNSRYVRQFISTRLQVPISLTVFGVLFLFE